MDPLSSSDVFVCPFDGQVHRLSSLTPIESDFVSDGFKGHAQDTWGDPNLGDVHNRSGRSSVAEANGGGDHVPGPKALFREESGDSADESILDRVDKETWFEIPCDVDGHYVPRTYLDAWSEGRSSIVALAGLPGSGKTHVMAALAYRLRSTNALHRGVGVSALTRGVGSHWDTFSEAYVAPLFVERKAIPFSDDDANPYMSLLMEVEEQVGLESKREWIAVVDSWGEATLPRQIAGRGRYVASADTVLLCIDGSGIVSLLDDVNASQVRALLDPGRDGRRDLGDESLVNRSQAMPEDTGELGAGAGDQSTPNFLEPEEPVGEQSAAEEDPIDGPIVSVDEYATSLAQYLSEPDVQKHRRSVGKPEVPNLVVAITKSDEIVDALRQRASPALQHLAGLLSIEAHEELELSKVWRRQRQVVAILYAAGLASMVSELQARFIHPVFTIVSSTGCAPKETTEGFFYPFTTPQNIDGLMINHLLSRGFLGKRTQGKFGPADSSLGFDLDTSER